MRLIKSLAVLLLSATAMFGQSAVNPGGSNLLPGPGGNGSGVSSINGKTGAVSITSSDLPDFNAAAAAAAPVLSVNGSTGAVTVAGMALNPQPVPASPVAGTVIVSPNVIGYIPQDFMGLFYAKTWMTYGPNTAGTVCFFCTSNTRALGSFEHLGPGVLRLGNTEGITWTPAGVGSTVNQLAPSDVTAFAAFVKAAGWKVIYGLNYTNSASDVAEATYVANALGSSLIGWEIGNEPDGLGGSTTPANFASGWNTIALAVQAAVPGVQFTGPALGIPTNVATWTTPFMAANSSLVNLITQHFYIDSAAGTMTELLENQASNAFFTTGISQMATIRQTYSQPWRMAETNSFYGGGAPGLSNSYAAALYSLDYMLTAALQGASGVNFSCGMTGSNGSQPYTPISDTNGTTFGPKPEYAGLSMFALATQGQPGQMLSTALSATGVTLANAYTIQNAPGSYSTVIVNKDQTHNLSITLSFPQAISSANVYAMTDATGVADVTITNILLQGQPFDQTKKDGTLVLGAPYTAGITAGSATIYVPAASAVVVQSVAPAVVANTPLSLAINTPSGIVSMAPKTAAPAVASSPIQAVTVPANNVINSFNGTVFGFTQLASTQLSDTANLAYNNVRNTFTSPVNVAAAAPMNLFTTPGVTAPAWAANTYFAIDAASSTDLLFEAYVNAANVMNLQYTTGAGASLLMNTGAVTATPASILFRFSNNNSSKLALNGAGTLNLAGTIDMFTRAVTVAVDTATVDDSTIRCNAATQAETETLPAAPVTGEWFFYKKTDATANTCTLAGNGKTIDGATTLVLSTQYASVHLQYNGTSWDTFLAASGGSNGNATSIQGVAVAGVAGVAGQNVPTTALSAFAVGLLACGQADGSIGQAGCSSTANAASQVGYRLVEEGGGDNTNTNDNGAILNTLLSNANPCNATFTTSCVPAVIHVKAGIYKITTPVHPTLHSNTGNVVIDCEGSQSTYGGGRTIFNIVVPAGQSGFWFDAPAGSDQFHAPRFQHCGFSDGNIYTYTNAGNIPFGTFNTTAASDTFAGLHFSGINNIELDDIGFSYFIGDIFNQNGVNGGAVVTTGSPCKITAGQFVVVCASTTATAAQAAMFGQGFFWATDVGGTGKGYPQHIYEAHVSTGTAWAASHVYYQGDAIQDGTNTQMVTSIGSPAWAASHTYSVGDLVQDSNGNVQRVTVAGTSSTAHPVWSTTLNGTVTDGGVTWSTIEIGNVGGVSGTVAPTWATSLNATTTDGTVVWTLVATGTSTLVIGLDNVYQHASQAAAFNWYITFGGKGLVMDGYGNARTANGNTGTYTSFSQYDGKIQEIFSYCVNNPIDASGTFYNTFKSGGSISGTFGGAQSPSQYGVSRELIDGGWLAGSCPGSNSKMAPNGRVANSIGEYAGVNTDTIDSKLAANFFTVSAFFEVTHASTVDGWFENTGSGAQPYNFACTAALGTGNAGFCSWGMLEEGDVASTHSTYNKFRAYAISMGNGIEVGPNNLRSLIETQMYGSNAASALNYGTDTVNGHDIQLPVVGDPNCSSITACPGLASTQINGASGINKLPMVTPLTVGATCQLIGDRVQGTDGFTYNCDPSGSPLGSTGTVSKH